MTLQNIARAMLLALATSQLPQVYADTLDTPSRISRLAEHNRLSAVTRAGDTLVAVGPWGRILLGNAHASQWRQVPVPVSSDLVAVSFADAEHGWAVGHDGVVLHSADGGQSWVKQLDGRQLGKLLLDYYQPRVERGEVDAEIMDSVARMEGDGPAIPLLDVSFSDANNGLVVGAFNLALETRDGGQTWMPLMDRTQNPDGMHLYALTRAGDELYLAGERGLLRRWNPQTRMFERLPSPYRGTFFGLSARGSTLVAYGLRGNAFSSQDHGQHWQPIETPGDASFTASTVLADGSIVLASQAGQLLIGSADGSGFKPLRSDKPMPFFGVAVSDQQTLVAVGPYGVRVQPIK
ncbi:glycosyl hydrolase [Pseudomonas capeferrum]|uniref:YCF48-related protein n=1 Tax=Pseudomonas capeferrum TaxID=1495066 RepID=UPI0015E3866D|nr:YCF48-related protein [Pseudomonas capeferrum]MBA1204823.1 glycosyl hydrolase [Pseudomonas capeferrum]